ncbi:RidA family protein [Nocardia sp. NPDC003482]
MTTVTHINPSDMHSNPAYSQAVRIPAGYDTLHIGGQNGTDATGSLVGPDLKSQSRQALLNIQSCVRAAGGDLENIVKWTIFIKAGEPLREGFAAFQEIWGRRPNPPAITGVFVSDLAVPGALVEIEAIAALPPA